MVRYQKQTGQDGQEEVSKNDILGACVCASKDILGVECVLIELLVVVFKIIRFQVLGSAK